MNGAERPGFHPEALNRLLTRLDDDRDRAGQKYEQLRRKLTLFFEARQCNPFAEELADRTLDVVARRIEEGVEIYACDASHYCYGVAQNVLRDHWKRAKMEPLTRDLTAVPSHTSEREEEVQCLDLCLSGLPPEIRYLIQEYYREERRVKIDHRQQLAKQIGISVNALRIRAHQIRRKLEECVRSCLKRDPLV